MKLQNSYFIEMFLASRVSWCCGVLCIVTTNRRPWELHTEHLPLLFVHAAVQQTGCLASKCPVFVCCLTEPQTGTLDSVQWCLINANAMNRPLEKISNDCLLCLCVAMTVKPLFDHSQWILLRQSFTSTPTVINICCYLKGSPPIYNGLLN